MSDTTVFANAQDLQKEPDLFDFRLSSARRNLDALGEFVNSIQGRNTLLAELREKLVDDRSQILDKLQLLKKQIDDIQWHSQRRLPNANEIKKLAESADGHLRELNELFADAKEQANKISVLQLDPKAMTPRNDEFSRKIDGSREQLMKIRAAARRSDIKPWQDLKGLGSLWLEYLDYLAGLSLRHDGLDNGVCDIADALIRDLQRSVTSLAALAIPGREGCGGTLPKIVYLRFPEWTVWALPLAAHELWHIAETGAFIATTFYDRASGDLDNMPSEEATTESERASVYKRWHGTDLLRDCLADAFGTYTMGPSYAWSSLLLSLDPTIVDHHFRAQTTLSVLKRLNEYDGTGPFDAVLFELTQRWNQAIQEAGQVSRVLPNDLATWTQAFLDHLGRLQIPDLQFPTADWSAYRTDWVSLLRDGNGKLDMKRMSIRFVLTAAWKARIEKPSAVDEIAERCGKFCRAFLKNAGPSSGSGPNTDIGEWPNAAD